MPVPSAIRNPGQNPVDSTRISHKPTVQDRTACVPRRIKQRTNDHEIEDKRTVNLTPTLSAIFQSRAAIRESGAEQKERLVLRFRVVGLVGIFRFGVGGQFFAELGNDRLHRPRLEPHQSRNLASFSVWWIFGESLPHAWPGLECRGR